MASRGYSRELSRPLARKFSGCLQISPLQHPQPKVTLHTCLGSGRGIFICAKSVSTIVYVSQRPEPIPLQLEAPLRMAERSTAMASGMGWKHPEGQCLLVHRINQTMSANTIRRSTPEAQVRIAMPLASSGSVSADGEDCLKGLYDLTGRGRSLIQRSGRCVVPFPPFYRPCHEIFD